MRIRSGLRSTLGQRVVSVVGTLSVVVTFALLPSGVRVARSEDRPAPNPSQATAPSATPAPKVSPFVKAEDTEQARRPGVSGIEISPGVVVLNTRGFNYGPPPTPLAPEALEHEKTSR